MFAIIAITVLVILVVQGYHAWETNQRYQTALAALDLGQYVEAYRLFTELGDYKDSPRLSFLALCPSPTNPVLGNTCTRSTDGMVMVYVVGGSFLMGSAVQDMTAHANEKPQHSVILDSFWIDRTEVTNAQYEVCVTAGVCASSDYAGDAYLNGAAYPVVGVSWHDAVNYCVWAGGQLPTEVQWEYAARGPGSLHYPWGNHPPTCNLAQFRDCDGTTMPVSSFSPDGDSWVGVTDIVGNVWEWVADWYNSDYYAVSPEYNPSGPDSGNLKVIRGGAWYYSTRHLRTTYRDYNTPTFRGSGVGFRCAQG